MEMEAEIFCHFSHRHPLQLKDHVLEEDGVICSGCELDLSGPAYICTKESCGFSLHDLCFDLPRQVRHRSHPKHPLTLLSAPPYGDGEFTCDACGHSGHGFTFHCERCKFDLHVGCASLPESEDREDHEHPLMLLYSFPHHHQGDDLVKSSCYVCQGSLGKRCWLYYCSTCDCGTHLECVDDGEAVADTP